MIFRLFKVLVIPASVLAAMSSIGVAQETPTVTPSRTPVVPVQKTPVVVPVPKTPIIVPARETPSTPASKTPVIRQQQVTQRICSLDPVEDLLPPPQKKSGNPNSVLSYLAEQGFTQNQEGSWVCYANDPKKEGRYFTMFKVQETSGRLIGSSFLDQGSLITGQDNRSLDFFMMLVERHMNNTQENRQGIRRYLEAFISLVKQGKIKPTRRGFLFDQPNRALVLYHTLSSGTLKGTAITVNIDLPKNVGSRSTSVDFSRP